LSNTGGTVTASSPSDEIHPDYYQIPIADREALMREVAEADDEPHHHEAHSEGGDDADDDERPDGRRAGAPSPAPCSAATRSRK